MCMAFLLPEGLPVVQGAPFIAEGTPELVMWSMVIKLPVGLKQNIKQT